MVRTVEDWVEVLHGAARADEEVGKRVLSECAHTPGGREGYAQVANAMEAWARIRLDREADREARRAAIEWL